MTLRVEILPARRWCLLCFPGSLPLFQMTGVWVQGSSWTRWNQPAHHLTEVKNRGVFVKLVANWHWSPNETQIQTHSLIWRSNGCSFVKCRAIRLSLGLDLALDQLSCLSCQLSVSSQFYQRNFQLSENDSTHTCRYPFAGETRQSGWQIMFLS